MGSFALPGLAMQVLARALLSLQFDREDEEEEDGQDGELDLEGKSEAELEAAESVETPFSRDDIVSPFDGTSDGGTAASALKGIKRVSIASSPPRALSNGMAKSVSAAKLTALNG